MDVKKRVTEAQKRLTKLINNMAADAKAETAIAFDRARKNQLKKEGK